MSKDKILEDAKRLADRLGMLADEVEAAAHCGIPIPYLISVTREEIGGASFSATEAEFAAWAEYTEAEVKQYDYDGAHWSRAEADLNGLRISFAVQHESAARTEGDDDADI